MDIFTCCALILCALLGFGLASVFIVDTLIDKYRRKKYPEYFRLYDTALTAAIDLSKVLNNRLSPVKTKIKIYQDGLLMGECTEEFHRNRIDKLMDEYREISRWYQEEKEKVESMCRLADKYAKEHNLKWGELY